jgi:hypothetical protein
VRWHGFSDFSDLFLMAEYVTLKEKVDWMTLTRGKIEYEEI